MGADQYLQVCGIFRGRRGYDRGYHVKCPVFEVLEHGLNVFTGSRIFVRQTTY